MLTPRENELLCRVEHGVPMGSMLRRYWLPALMSAELVAGSAPQQVRLLGETLLAFRDGDGCARLSDGYRCEGAGSCGPMLDRPARNRRRPHSFHRAPGVAHAADEGARRLQLCSRWKRPSILAQRFLAQRRSVRERRYGDQRLQHSAKLVLERPSRDRQPRMEVQDTPYGFRYAAIRKPTIDPDTKQYVRVTLFVAPGYVFFPAPAGWGNLQMFVPMDDENVMFYHVKYRYATPLDDAARAQHAAFPAFRIGFGWRRAPVRSSAREQLSETARRCGAARAGAASRREQRGRRGPRYGAIYDRSRTYPTSDVRDIACATDARIGSQGGIPLGLGAEIRTPLRAEERMLPLECHGETVGAFARTEGTRRSTRHYGWRCFC